MNQLEKQIDCLNQHLAQYWFNKIQMRIHKGICIIVLGDF